MTEKIIVALEEIGHLAKSSPNAAKLEQAIQLVRTLIAESNVGANLCVRPHDGGCQSTELGGHAGPPLLALDKELSVWQSKWDVLWKEPIAREGMAKHAQYWVERLKK